MDRRHHARDVGDVARADRFVRRVGALGQPEPLELAAVDGGEREVRAQRRRRALVRDHLEARAGRRGRALGAAQQARRGVLEHGVLERAHPDARGGALGDHVRRLAAVGHDAVDARAARELLAQQADRDEERDHAVERVDAALGIGRRVRGAAVEDELELASAEEEPVRAPHVRGVRHHAPRARPSKTPAATSRRLPIPSSSAGQPTTTRLDGVVGQHRGERAGGEQARRAREVVAAGVADLGQRVHLGEQRRAPARRCRAAPRRRSRAPRSRARSRSRARRGRRRSGRWSRAPRARARGAPTSSARARAPRPRRARARRAGCSRSSSQRWSVPLMGRPLVSAVPRAAVRARGVVASAAMVGSRRMSVGVERAADC